MKSQAKVIKMIPRPAHRADGEATKASCGGQGCRIYTLPFVESRPWDGNRRTTIKVA